jgi:uncharacterized protein YdcH (DUF465 family)
MKMDDNMNNWDGEERREYCAMHCRVVSDTKASTPWRVFIFTAALFMSTMGGLIVYHQRGMSEIRTYHEQFKIEVNARLVEMEEHVHEKIKLIERSNNYNFERLFDKIDSLSDNINQLSTQTEVIRQKQEMVLQKIKITE